VGEVLFGTDADKRDPVCEVEGTLARDQFALLAARAESFGFCSQRLAFLGRELEPAQGIAIGALENVDAIEGFFGSCAELVKICHGVRLTLLLKSSVRRGIVAHPAKDKIRTLKTIIYRLLAG
jgi:hypothetical protein